MISIRVIPRSSRSAIEKMPDGSLKVYVHPPAVDGQANKELVKLLAEYFDVAKSSIKIAKGEKSRNKLIEISKRV